MAFIFVVEHNTRVPRAHEFDALIASPNKFMEELDAVAICAVYLVRRLPAPRYGITEREDA